MNPLSGIPLLLLLVLALTGCSSRQLATPDGKYLFRSQRLGNREQIKELVYRTPDGSEFVMRGYSSDQVEALAAVTEAAVRGAISSGNPAASASGLFSSLGSGASLGEWRIPEGMKAVQRGAAIVLVPKDDPSTPVPEIEVP
jgi:hypothetical protein